jgi:hypothetical protein
VGRVVTGRHGFEVPHFQDMLRSLEGIDAYPQDFDDWALDHTHRAGYDAVVFYCFEQQIPDPASSDYLTAARAALSKSSTIGEGASS